MRFLGIVGAVCAGALLAGDWSTYNGDAHRTGWAQKETTLNKKNVSKLRVEWTAQLENEPLDMWSLTPPVVVNTIYGPQGVRDIVIVGGSSDHLYAVNAEDGKIMWHKKFAREGTPPNKGSGGWLCPNAMVATPLIDHGLRTVYAIASDGKLHSLNVLNGEDQVAPRQFVPPFSKNWSLNLWEGTLYAPVSQGCNGTRDGVYAIDAAGGDKVASFRTYGGIWGRAGVAIGSNGRVYAEIGDGPFDPENKKFSDAFISLEPKTLALADWYAPKNQAFIDKKDLDMGNISPVVFPFKGRELIAGSGKEGAIFLLDAKSLGGADHRTPLYRSEPFTNEEAHFMGRGFWGALSTWEDQSGTRWLYGPAYGPTHAKAPAFGVSNGDAPHGSIMAFKVEEKDGKPMLSPAWRSVDMVAPDPVVIANGVVFALATGDETKQVDNGGGILSSKTRLDATKPAILYALDAETGKTLYSSGDALKSFVHFSGLAVSEGHVYAVTYDGRLYSFGLAADAQ